MKTRVFIIVLAIILSLVFAGCGSPNSTDNANIDADVEQNEVISPEFKAAMDSYEAFFDEYVEFMKKYNDSSSTDQATMFSDFADYMTKYSEMIEKIDAVDQDELSTDELAYYTKVYADIMRKIGEII